MDLEVLKREVCERVEERRAALLAVAHEIHAHPELAFQEQRAAALLVRTLAEEGLPVEAPAYGLDTAFECRVGDDGPTVALLAEYDALPGIGHACGHNLIATAALGAATGAGGARLASCRAGCDVLGTPAEEQGGGKELLARAGAFDGVDAALMVHPAGVDLATMPSLALAEVDVVYRGRAAHASAMPERGVNALDALVTAYQAIAQLRQHIRRASASTASSPTAARRRTSCPSAPPAASTCARATPASSLALKAAGRGLLPRRRRGQRRRPRGELARPRLPGAAHQLAAGRALPGSTPRRWVALLPVDKLPSSVLGTTDMGNVSHRVPSIHPMIAAAPPHCTIHAAEFAEHAGGPLGDAAAIDGAKALAMTALDFWLDPDLRARARACFEDGRPA